MADIADSIEAAQNALQAGDHFYQPNNGKPRLRSALARYMNGLYGTSKTKQNITVTASGMQGLALTALALINSGDRVVCIDPVWPNLGESFKIAGGQIDSTTLIARDGRWHLDMEELLAKLTHKTKALLINSPNNPTGWVCSVEEQKIILDHCRKQGIWIVADDVYARLYQHGSLAPGFQHLANADDLLISINSFSKAWSMTGWRLGWITAPASLEKTFAHLTEFNIACPAGFIQEAGLAMIEQGEAEVSLLQHRLRKALTLTRTRLKHFEDISFIEPDGAFYCFFSVKGLTDSLAFAHSLLEQTKVGLAPGLAFGPAGGGYLRLCYAQDEQFLNKAFDRLDKGFNAVKKSLFE
ncbi:MAG: aminotransferase [Alphaproteobacteria bacterium]|nr:MAG: aminotransferase [Alphaproteobacteria bacterium]